MKHKIVFLDKASLPVSVRRPAFAHEWLEYANTAPEQAGQRLRGATVAIVNKVSLRQALLEQLPKLQLIAVAATGTDKIDLAYCRARGIAVCNIRDYATHTVPEHVFALILALRRKLLEYREDVRAGRWQQAEQFCLFTHPIGDLHGSTLGIVGYGALGRGTAAIAQGFGMRVIVAARPGTEPGAGRVALERVLEESDVVSLHCPLTPDTRNLIGAAELTRMKRSAILINTARGGLVDEHALAAALRAGTIAGAGFDVLSEEPPREGHVLLAPTLPNFLLTPHVAWSSAQAMQALADQLIDNIEAFAAGKPRHRVS